MLRIRRTAETHNITYQPEGAVKMLYTAWTARQSRVVDTEPAELDGCGSVTAKNSAKDQPVVHASYAMTVLAQKAGDVWT